MTFRVLPGDNRDVLRTLDAESVHAIVTDPPYHLTQTSRGGHARTNNPETPFGRHRIGDKGFMGNVWDGGDIAFRPETWEACMRVMKPGAHLLAFGGTRTYHRVACAIEDAGFELRDCIMWIYGSGFPKSLDVAKAIEAEDQGGLFGASDVASAWDGWGTALKPAYEPIIVARKPMVGTVTDNVIRFGTGAINIDGCRVPHEGAGGSWGVGKRPGGFANIGAEKGDSRPNGEWSPLGRWPANIVHDGSEEVVALFPSESGAQAPVTGSEDSSPIKNTYGARARVAGAFHGDTGSAARFFYCAKASRADRDEGLDGFEKRPLLWSSGDQNPGSFQSPNTDREVRNFHPTVKPTALMRWLCRLVTPPGGVVLDPFMGSGSTGKACVLEGFDFIGIEQDERYIPIAQARIAFAQQARA